MVLYLFLSEIYYYPGPGVYRPAVVWVVPSLCPGVYRPAVVWVVPSLCPGVYRPAVVWVVPSLCPFDSMWLCKYFYKGWTEGNKYVKFIFWNIHEGRHRLVLSLSLSSTISFSVFRCPDTVRIHIFLIFSSEPIFFLLDSKFCGEERHGRHCKLTKRKRSNSIYITVTTLWPRCSSMSEFSQSVRKANLFSYILRIQNVFVLLNISAIKKLW